MGYRGGRATQKKVRLLGMFLVDSLRRDLYSRAINACLAKYLEHSLKALVKIDSLQMDVYERAVLRAVKLSSTPLHALVDVHGDARTPELVYFAYGGGKPRVMAFVCKTSRDASELVDLAKIGLAAATAKAGGFADRIAADGIYSADEVAQVFRGRPPVPDAQSAHSEPAARPAYRRYVSHTATRSSTERRGGGAAAVHSGDSAAYSSDSTHGVGGGRPSKLTLSRALSQPVGVTGAAAASQSHALGGRLTFGRRRSLERVPPQAAAAAAVPRRGAATLAGRLRTSYDYIRHRSAAAYDRGTSEDESAAESPTYEGRRPHTFASYAEDDDFRQRSPESGLHLVGSHRYARTTSYDREGVAANGSAAHWMPADRQMRASTVQRTISMQ